MRHGAPRSLRLVATGDLLLTQRLSRRPEPGFAEVVEEVRDAEVAVTNLECPVFDGRGYPAAESGGIWPWAGAWAGEELGWFGFHLVGLANNHMMDFGAGGLRATCESLAHAGLGHTGAGVHLGDARRPVYWDSPAGRVAMIAATATFPSHARAGRQRPDFRGRPGVNPLRFSASYACSPEDLAALETLGQHYHLGRGRMTIPGEEASPASKREAWFGGVHLHVGPLGEVISAANPDDLAGNLRSVQEAARQADWVIVQVHSHESHPDPDGPAPFLTAFCHACIDAGAHVVIGHGPHRTRAVEIHRNRPILYSLGNFVMQNETTPVLPADVYETFGFGDAATPAEIFEARSDGDRRGFPAQPLFWQTVLPAMTFGPGGLEELTLRPLTLGRLQPRPRRGLPEPAQGAEADEILGRVAGLSASCGTTFRRDGGLLRWPPKGTSVQS